MAEAAPKLVEATPEPAPPPRRTEVVVELGWPVQAHGEMIKKLVFRRPTAGDLMSLGDAFPVIIGPSEIRPNSPAMGQIMSLLAAVPPSTIKAMDSEDFVACTLALTGFFLPR